ncbi:hypothetical protein C9374_013308 [Naegleria lovaniensis]|uniref:Uncharacterized protein n=1 Tax=Naegleria lovaniensis TaxID=51637 RepID=A0AA88KN82_NAELO|nr:uncharacterized protein C9374_013308 [Naegleria lovaniensis]KAG2391823.1 hypothetical protein C9374_013308 [Naegleria lovaniensis]
MLSKGFSHHHQFRLVSRTIFGGLFSKNNSTKSFLTDEYLNYALSQKNNQILMMMNDLANSRNGIIRSFHSHHGLQFFDFKKVKETKIKELSDSEKMELLSKLNLAEELFKNITTQLGPALATMNEKPEQKLPIDLVTSIYQLIRICLEVIPDVHTPVSKARAFYESSAGMGILNICKQAQLLAAKGIMQEWVDMDSLKMHVRPEELRAGTVIYPEGVIDDTYILFQSQEAQISYSAYVYPAGDLYPYNRFSLIASAYFLFLRLKDCPTMVNADNLINYVKEVVREYNRVKQLYMSSKKPEKDIDYTTTVTYDAQSNAYSYLKKTFTEDEFDWFEDLETNLPIHLGAFIKACELVSQIDSVSDKTKIITSLDDCLRINPNNPYILHMKAACYRALNVEVVDPNTIVENYLKGVEICDQALQVMKNAKVHYLQKLEKTHFEENEVTSLPEDQRVNDLKFSPIHYLKGVLLHAAAESDLPPEFRHQYGLKSLECLSQVESFSRLPPDFNYLVTKAQAYYACDMFEQTLGVLAPVEKFQGQVDNASIITAIVIAANAMISLGYADVCMDKLDEYIQTFNNDPRLRFEKIMCKEFLSRSKDHYREIVKEYQDLLQEIQHSSDPHNLTTVPMIQARMNYVQETIDNPAYAERW